MCGYGPGEGERVEGSRPCGKGCWVAPNGTHAGVGCGCECHKKRCETRLVIGTDLCRDCGELIERHTRHVDEPKPEPPKCNCVRVFWQEHSEICPVSNSKSEPPPQLRSKPDEVEEQIAEIKRVINNGQAIGFRWAEVDNWLRALVSLAEKRATEKK